MTGQNTNNLSDAIRNLIVCDTQFGWTGETTLKLPELLDLQARGWLIEGDENNEFSLTTEGESVVARALQRADERATPSANWSAEGQPDPHGRRYACERAALALGNLTDDELANAVFLHGNEQPAMADLAAGKALAGIVYLTAAKERIRWLSRALVDATCKQPLQVGEVQGDAVEHAKNLDLLRAGYHVDAEPRAAALNAAITALAARQPGAQEPVVVEAVATIKRDGDGELYVDWLTEGGIHDLPVGDVLLAANSAITNDEGYGEVYAAPPAQGIDLGQQRPLIARSLAEWHENDGNVMWWAWCGRGWAGEPAWCGTPNDSDWPGYHTHWTQHPSQPALIDQRDAAPGVGNG